MAPPKPSGRRKENFVQWKDSPQLVERVEIVTGGASASDARKKKRASRPTTVVTEQVQCERKTNTNHGTQSHGDSDTERDMEVEVGATLSRPAEIRKFVSPNRFVAPRVSGPSTSVLTPPNASGTPQHYAGQTSSSPERRPLRRVQEQEQHIADHEPFGDPTNIAGDTCRVGLKVKCMSLVWTIFAVVPLLSLVSGQGDRTCIAVM